MFALSCEAPNAARQVLRLRRITLGVNVRVMNCKRVRVYGRIAAKTPATYGFLLLHQGNHFAFNYACALGVDDQCAGAAVQTCRRSWSPTLVLGTAIAND